MPLDRGIIEQQLQTLGESLRWWDQRELRDLPAVLHADEQILAISRGKIARPRWLHRSWLVVVTDRRLICLRSSRRSWRQFELSAHQADRVALRIGLFRGRVLIAAGDRTYRVLVPRADVYNLLSAISSWGTPGKEALPGFGPTRMARRLFDHVLALPAAALSPQPLPNGTRTRNVPAPQDPRVEFLENQVQQLQEQVDFLEQLLKQRNVTDTSAS